VNLNSTVLSGMGSGNTFILKYDNNGTLLWAKCASTSAFSEGKSIAADEEGNVYLTGYYINGTINFDNNVLNNSGSSDIFIVKFDLNGNVLWAKKVGGTGFDASNGIAIDKTANVYITGYYKSPLINFDINQITNNSTADRSDFFLAKLDRNTGFNTISTLNSKSIFPNPFKETLNVEFIKSENILTLAIFNSSVQKVLKIENINSKSIKIQRGNLPAGIYFMQIEQINNSIYSEKIIIID
jgi:hypothetical protein